MDKLKNIFTTKERFLVIIKVVIIIILILFLLIPVATIKSLIYERENRNKEAEENIINLAGGEVIVTGPFITVPYSIWKKDHNNQLRETVHYTYFLPKKLNIHASLEHEIRNRGIYKVLLFTSNIDISGSFQKPDFSDWDIKESDIHWKEAFLSLQLPDLKALRDSVSCRWNDNELPFIVKKGSLMIYDGEIQCILSDLHNMEDDEENLYSIDLKIRGGRKLFFTPLGNETDVALEADWNSPSFTGAFLPDKPDIEKTGFRAHWYIRSLSRNYPDKWENTEDNIKYIQSSEFGVNLIQPVNRYQKTERSVKYSLLFIIIPFIAFFLFEVISKKKIHPFQYILVGLAIVIFYLLLLSLSEHIAFSLSYLIACLATTGLITFYTYSALSSWKYGSIIAAILSFLYIFLYVILLSEDYALLIGSIGLFSILTAIMFITIKIDWYAISKNSNEIKEEAQIDKE